MGIFRLISHAPFDPVVEALRASLQGAGLAVRVDSSSGSVGRRYARADELGIPFGITVDFQTLIDRTVTLRDRDTMAQVRIPIAGLLDLVSLLVAEKITWAKVMERYIVVNQGGEEEDEEEEDGQAKEVKEKVVTNRPVIVEASTRGAFSRPNPNYKPAAAAAAV